MADLVVITPSRGRPGQFAELADAIRDTADFDVALVGLVDDDDPDLARVQGARRRHRPSPHRAPAEPLRLDQRYARHAALHAPYLASLGDDHLPRTRGWDRLLVSAIRGLAGPGFAYGNDLYQGRTLPTAWVASSAARARARLDDAPRLRAHVRRHRGARARPGRRPDRVRARGRHRAPAPPRGKADWDASYRETNTDARYAADKAAYDAWLTCGLATDAAAVRALTHRTGG
jgi:hypothetical protein